VAFVNALRVNKAEKGKSMASIYPKKQKDGRPGVYEIQYFQNGKRIRRSLKTRDRRIALQLKQEFEVKLRRGEHKEPTRKSVEQYFEDYVQDTSYRKPSTNKRECYEVRRFLNFINKQTINNYTQQDVYNYLARFDKKSPKSFNSALLDLKRFFRVGVQKGYFAKNPTEGIHHRKVPHALPKFFTLEEYKKIEEAAYEGCIEIKQLRFAKDDKQQLWDYLVAEGYLSSSGILRPQIKLMNTDVEFAVPEMFSRYRKILFNMLKMETPMPVYPLLVVARYTGFRLAELLHLEWQDFDWKRKVVRVLNKPKFNHTVKNYQTRVVPISEELRDKLLPFIKKDGICFPTYRGVNPGEKYVMDGPKRMLQRVLKAAEIERNTRVGYHNFRHTFASHLVQNNVPIYKVSKWLGHSSVLVTQIYAHFAPIYDEDIEKLTINSIRADIGNGISESVTR